MSLTKNKMRSKALRRMMSSSYDDTDETEEKEEKRKKMQKTIQLDLEDQELQPKKKTIEDQPEAERVSKKINCESLEFEEQRAKKDRDRTNKMFLLEQKEAGYRAAQDRDGPREAYGGPHWSQEQQRKVGEYGQYFECPVQETEVACVLQKHGSRRFGVALYSLYYGDEPVKNVCKGGREMFSQPPFFVCWLNVSSLIVSEVLCQC